MDYPKWTPPSICEKHKKMVAELEGLAPKTMGRGSAGLYEPIFRRLITDGRMRYVWPVILKNHPLKSDVLARRLFGLAFERDGAWECYVAMEAASAAISAKAGQFMSRHQEKKEYKKVADLARDLAAALEACDLNHGPVTGGAMRFFPESFFSALLPCLDLSRWEGDYCDAIEHVHRRDLPAGWPVSSRLFNKDGESVGPMLSLTGNLYGCFSDYMMDERRGSPALTSAEWPTVSELLKRLSEVAAQRAEKADSKPRFAERDSKHREATHVIRHLAKFMHFFTGNILRGTVASLASVAIDLPDALDANDVDSALKGFDYEAP